MGTLYVSGPNVKSAEEASKLFARNGHRATVIATHSSVLDPLGRYKYEKGLQIVLDSDKEVQSGWDLVKEAFNLDCAYVKTASFRGCVHDFLREDSLCPGKKRIILRSRSFSQF